MMEWIWALGVLIVLIIWLRQVLRKKRNEREWYVWALVAVILLVGLGIGMTFIGRGEDGAEDVLAGGEMEENVVSPHTSEQPDGGKVSVPTDEPGMAAKPDAEPTAAPEITAKPDVAPTEIPLGTMGGYMGYTGYMDECYQYEGYKEFANRDYDADGFTDRVWRERIKDTAICTYRIELGNGDVLQTGNICDGIPDVRAGDLDTDGVNEILVSANDWMSTDPNSYGEWAVFKKQEKGYEIVKLPEGMADYDGNGNGGVLPAYQPKLKLVVQEAGDYKARIYTETLDRAVASGEGTKNVPLLDVVVDFGEEAWKTIGMDSYLTKNRWEGPNYDEVLYYAEIVEEPVPLLRAYVSLFGKWCEDEIVLSLLLKDGEFQVYSMEYVQENTMYRKVDLEDKKTYQLEIACSYMATSRTQMIRNIRLVEIVNDIKQEICEVDLNAASVREWGEPQVISGNEGCSIIVEDFNFDGCDDLAVQGWTGAKNIPYYCFLWNPVTKKYEYSALISNVEVDKENKLVVSATNDGGGQYSTTYYKYDDKNQLHMVRYVEENLSPLAVFPKLDLFYYGDDVNALPAVDVYDEEVGAYVGVRVHELTYYAKKALEEMYAYSGYGVEQAYFMAYDSGKIVFGHTEEDMKQGRHFYSGSYNSPSSPAPESTTSSDYYKVATNKTAEEVEAFARLVKETLLQKDFEKLSGLVAYPITIGGEQIESPKEFLNRDYASKVNPKFWERVEAASCEQMFCNWQGIMLEDTGSVWFAEVLDGDLSSQGLKVTALNDLVDPASK